jgi:hypothetical protein
MSVRPVLIKDYRRSAIQNHRLKVGNDSYNRFEPLVQRDRTFFAGKRPRSTDNDSEQAPKTPKLDSNVVFSQLSAQDTALKEANSLMDEFTALNAKAEAQADPRIDCLAKIVKTLIKAHEGLCSSVLDSVKLAENAAPNVN